MSLLDGSQYLGHSRSQLLPGIFLHFELPLPGLGEFVVFCAAVVFRSSPARLDPATALETVQGRIKRPLLYLKNIARHLLDPLGYCPSMLGAESERSQDQEVESTLRKVNSSPRHALPFHFYTEPYTASCRSARGVVFVFLVAAVDNSDLQRKGCPFSLAAARLIL